MGFNPDIHDKIYVVECREEGYWYVGSTLQELYDRADEHSGVKPGGCKWVRLHGGLKKIYFLEEVDTTEAQRIENDVTAFLMTWFGRTKVRGGDHNNCRKDCYTAWLGWLPEHLRAGDVPPLHACVMPHFPLKLRRLINRFESLSGLHHPDELYADVFS